jgi:predicted AAA+ superfamily ATPase
MWRRLAEVKLHDFFRHFPAVLILGARQVGKTTLARQTFPDMPYCDLEEPRTRQLFSDDPTFHIESRAQPSLILDEAQSVPQIFAALRGVIDRRRSLNGRFLLLGSAQPSLIRQVSESLAGRVGVLELDPLTAVEVQSGEPVRSWQELWLQGGFPDAVRGSFREWWESYLRTYIERDLPHLGVSADPLLLRRMLTMLAHAQGGLFNASQFGKSLGISYHTVQRYVDILERTFLVRRLPPYFRNVGKRLTKAPKVYLRDTGLLHHLLNINSQAELESHPIRGASWETFVLEDLIRRERLRFSHTQCYFWRTLAGAEVDLVLDRGSELIALEIKTGRGDKWQAIRTLEQAAQDIGASTAWILDQAEGSDYLRPNTQRRGFAQSLVWLPPGSGESPVRQE